MTHRLLLFVLMNAAVALTACTQPADTTPNSSDALYERDQPLNQGNGVELVPDGLSNIGWIFIEGEGSGQAWHRSGNGVGQGDHRGDDYYGDDWNFGSGSQDLGKVADGAPRMRVVDPSGRD